MNTQKPLEKDWKLFKERLKIWQENYLEKLNREYISILFIKEKVITKEDLSGFSEGLKEQLELFFTISSAPRIRLN